MSKLFDRLTLRVLPGERDFVEEFARRLRTDRSDALRRLLRLVKIFGAGPAAVCVKAAERLASLRLAHRPLK